MVIGLLTAPAFGKKRNVEEFGHYPQIKTLGVILISQKQRTVGARRQTTIYQEHNRASIQNPGNANAQPMPSINDLSALRTNFEPAEALLVLAPDLVIV